jgi:RND family efflux transporter MFP subunit
MKALSSSVRGARWLASNSGGLVSVAAILFCVHIAVATAQSSGPDVITAQARPQTSRLEAFGQVSPITTVTVSAAETGVITGLKIRPGMRVRAGEELARLSGPGIEALILQSEADVRNAQAQFDAAQQSLDIARQQLPAHLTTRQTVQQAESAAAQARSGLANAQSRLKAVRQLMTVSSPADGIVLQLISADGALVSAGQPVLTIQPANGLWLVAEYYGDDLAAMHVGMTGQFQPADGGVPVKVRVVSIPGALTAAGGESIAFEAIGSRHSWISGEAGTVALELPQRQMVAVPTRALVLNQGKWWVMVHSAAGDHPQEVVPGPTRGWDTFIVSGLAPGTEVVVNNAYLLFHASVAEQFQIPD